MDDREKSKKMDLKKNMVDKISERLKYHTLSRLNNDYEAVILSIFTYINNHLDKPDPQALVEYYLDYKLSVDAEARKELIEMFKVMEKKGEEPAASQPQEEDKKKKFKLI